MAAEVVVWARSPGGMAVDLAAAVARAAPLAAAQEAAQERVGSEEDLGQAMKAVAARRSARALLSR